MGKFTQAIFHMGLLSVCLTLAQPQGQAAPPSQIKAPCAPETETKKGFLRKCSEVIHGNTRGNAGGGNGATPGLPADPGILSLVDSTIKKAISDPTHSLYRGEIVDLSATANPQGRPFGTPVCNLTPNPFNQGKSETDFNHLGQSCGNPAGFTVSASRSGVSTSMHFSSSQGTLEAAYLRGTWVQALTCHWQQVRREIEQTQGLRISSACSAIAEGAQKLTQSSEAASTKLLQDLGNQKNIADIWNCTADHTKDSIGSLRQSAQYLCASRMEQEALFKNLALCEVFARAGKTYRRAVNSPDAFLDELRRKVAGECNRKCTAQCSGCVGSGPKALAGAPARCSSCGTSCANACYPDELRKFMIEKASIWPSDGSCPFIPGDSL